LESSGTFELRRDKDTSDNDDITGSTLSGILSLGNNAKGSGDVSDGDLVRGFLDLDFLVGNEFRSSVVGDQLSASSVLFTDVAGTISKRHKDLGVDSLVDFETADFANVASNADNGADIRDLGDHTSNSDVTTDKISLQFSQGENLFLGRRAIDNVKFAEKRN